MPRAADSNPCRQSPRWPAWAGCCVLAIAGVAHAAPALMQEAGAQAHVVQPGETLWGISRAQLHHARRWKELQRDNPVGAPERLRVGQVLQFGTLAVVVELSGEAWLRRGHEPQQPIIVGSRLKPNDVLVTGPEAFVSLRLGDGSRVVLPSSSAVHLMSANGRLTRLKLLNGRIESYVERQGRRRFEIRTRSATTSVRGTHFRVRDEEGIAAVEVIDGSVDAARQEPLHTRRRVHIGAGRAALLDGAEALRPLALLPPPVQNESDDPRQVAATPVAGAVAYRMQLAADPNFLALVHEARVDAPRATVPPGLAAGIYHLRWTAFDASGIEGLPGAGILHWSGSPAPVAGTAEGSAQHLGDGRYALRWPGGSTGRQVLELDRSPDFASPLVRSPLPEGATDFTVGPIELPGRYHWRVRGADDGDAPNAVSAGGSFEAWEPRP